jgi:hypothetical protein
VHQMCAQACQLCYLLCAVQALCAVHQCSCGTEHALLVSPASPPNITLILYHWRWRCRSHNRVLRQALHIQTFKTLLQCINVQEKLFSGCWPPPKREYGVIDMYLHASPWPGHEQKFLVVETTSITRLIHVFWLSLKLCIFWEHY